eukprot:m.123399 g.123399  ORF g.123399 m.123399 type:complete len:839 (+) comp15677_c0_seq2:308-2824(+)
MTTVALVSLFVTCIIIQAEELTLYPWLIMPQGIVGSNGELYRGFLGDGARFINSTSSNGAGWHLINVTDSLIRETNVTDPDSSWKDNIVMAASGSRLAVYSFELQVLLQLESLDPDSGFLCDVSPLFHYDIGIAPTIVALDRGIAVVEMKSIHPPFQCDITFYPWNNATGVHLPALPCTYDAHISPRTRLAAYGSAIVSLHGGSLTKLDITSLTTEDMSASQADSYRLAIAMTHEWCCVPQKQPPNNELKSCSALSLTPFFTNSTHSMQWNKTAQFDIQPLEGDCEIPAVAACSNTSRLFAYIVLSSDSAHLRVLRLSEQMLPTDYYQVPVTPFSPPGPLTYSVACNDYAAVAMVDSGLQHPQPITIDIKNIETWVTYPGYTAPTTTKLSTTSTVTTSTSPSSTGPSVSSTSPTSTITSQSFTSTTVSSTSMPASTMWPTTSLSTSNTSPTGFLSSTTSDSTLTQPDTSTVHTSPTLTSTSSVATSVGSTTPTTSPTTSAATTSNTTSSPVSTVTSITSHNSTTTLQTTSSTSSSMPSRRSPTSLDSNNEKTNLALWMSVGVIVSLLTLLVSGWCWWRRQRRKQQALLFELSGMHDDGDKMELLEQGHRSTLPDQELATVRDQKQYLDLAVQTAVSQGDTVGLDTHILGSFDVKAAEPRLHLTTLACQYDQAAVLAQLLSCLDSPDDLAYDQRGYAAPHWAAAVDAVSCVEVLLHWNPLAMTLLTADQLNCMQVCADNDNTRTLQVLLKERHPEITTFLFKPYPATGYTLAEHSSQLCHSPETQAVLSTAVDDALKPNETIADARRRFVSQVAMRKLRRTREDTQLGGVFSKMSSSTQ